MELALYLSQYLSAQRDLAGLRLTMLVWRIAVVALLGITLVIAICTGVVLLLRGVAHGLGQMINGQMWIGELITGLMVLIILAAVLAAIRSRLQRTWQQKVLAKYEHHPPQ